MEKKPGSLRNTMLAMILIPLFLLGSIITIVSSYSLTRGMNGEVEDGLKNLSVSIAHTFDFMYPGDYKLVGKDLLALFKGDTILNGNFEIIDAIKEDTGVDVTLFHYDTRVLTTLADEDGERFIGSGAHKQIVQKVLETQQGFFFDNVLINGTTYFAYYTPLFNADGSCTTMLGVGKPAQNVTSVVRKAVIPILLIALLTTIITAYVIIRYTTVTASSILKIKAFLREVSKGNLTTKLDFEVSKRQDELGEMGRFVLHVQKALRELIEYDSLTGLYNRRCGEDKLKEAIERATRNHTSLTIAIGDIDFFKKFNDTYGHECGDNVLKECARIFNQDMLGKGFVARWGGEEFLFIYEQEFYEKAHLSIKETLNHIREASITYEDQILHVTMTFGIVEHLPNDKLFQSLKKADDKLYEGKSGGRNQVVS